MAYNTVPPARKARKTSAKAILEVIIHERPAAEPNVGMKGSINAAVAQRNGEAANISFANSARGMTGIANPAFARGSEKTMPPRPMMDVATVDGWFQSKWLARKLDGPTDKNEAHILPDAAVAHIAINQLPSGEFAWFDMQTGAGAKGVVSLLQHLLRIGESEAAFRAATLISCRLKLNSISRFLAEKAA